MGALAIFPIAAALAVLGRKRFEEAVFPAIGLVIITLMFTGMAGVLRFGIFIIPVYVVISLVVLVIERNHLKKLVFTPGLVAYAVLFVFFLFFTYGRSFIPDAAMSQYGTVVRHLYETGCVRNDTLYYTLYNPFPVATLWAYFVTYSQGCFLESMCLFANAIFIISGMMPFFRYIKSIKEGSWRWLVMTIFVILLPVLKIPEAYSSYGMAVPQAATLVYTFLMLSQLITYRAPGRTVLWYEIFAGLGLFVSCSLTKYGVFSAVPLILGMVTVAISGLKRRWDLLVMATSGCLATFCWSIYSYAIQEIDIDGMLLIPEVYMGAVLLAVGISVLICLYRKGYGKTVVMISICLGAASIGLVSFILKNSVNYEFVIEWIGEFTDKLFVGRSEEEYYVIGKRVIPVYDATFLFILMMISGMACGKIGKKEKNNTSDFFSFSVAYIVGSVLYLLILCILYVNVIRIPHVPVKPVTVEYTTPLLVLSFSVVFSQAFKAWNKDWVIAIGTVILVACTYSDPVGAVLNKTERNDEYPIITDSKAIGDLKLKGDDRVFYIDKDLIENVPDSFKWAVFPAGADFINGLYFNPEPYKWNDEIKSPLTAAEFAEIIEDGDYTYVYLKNVDDFFWETYYLDFANFGADIKNDAMYSVEYDENGQLQLEYVVGAIVDESGEESTEEQ